MARPANASDTIAASARLWDGYRLKLPVATGKDDEVWAKYSPALNQIGIRVRRPDKDVLPVISHEIIHAYTASLQPPRLLPLNDVFYPEDPSWTEIFEDIMETVAEVHYRAGMAFPRVDQVVAHHQTASHPAVYAELVDLWIDTMSRASPRLSRKTAWEAALRGLSVLLTHVVPRGRGMGVAVLKAIRRNLVPEGWYTAQDIWFECYRKLDRSIAENQALRDQFTLAMPIGEHKSVAEAVFFIAEAIKNITSAPQLVTMIFPTLLELVTLESFVVLPVLLVDEAHNKAHVKVIHTTSHSRRTPDRTAAAMARQAAELAKEGKQCAITPVFVSLIEGSRRFRRSNARTRTQDCFQFMLELLPRLLKETRLCKPSCPGCILLFKDEKWKLARDTIMAVSSKTRRAMVEAARGYEPFLLTRAVPLMLPEQPLQDSLRLVPHYKFL